MSFSIGLSGIRAASSDLNITGNNIANASTVGFKAAAPSLAMCMRPPFWERAVTSRVAGVAE